MLKTTSENAEVMEPGLEAEVQEPKHIFVVDTNVLMLNCFVPLVLANGWPHLEDDGFGRQLIESAKKQRKLKDHPNHVVICDLVSRELDNLMHNDKQRHVHSLAARARGVLSNIRDLGQVAASEFASYVQLDNGSRIYFLEHNEEAFLQSQRFDPNIDDRLVWNFENIVKANLEMPYVVQLVSQDKILKDKARDRIATMLYGNPKQADIIKNCTGEFEFENTDDVNQIYRGNLKVEISAEEYKAFIAGTVDLTKVEERPTPLRNIRLKPNQLLEVHCGERKDHRIIKSEGEGIAARALENYEEFMQSAMSHRPEGRVTTALEIEVPDDIRSLADVDRLYKSDTSLADDYRLSLRKKAHLHKDDPRRAYQEVQLSLQHHRMKHGKKDLLHLPFNKKLKPKPEQMYALELLNDPNITVVSLIGPPGTGKTLWTLYSGLVQLTQDKPYKEIVYFRTPIGINEGHGFVKGDLRQKLEMWLKPCKDALMEIFSGYGGNLGQKRAAEMEVMRLEKDSIIRLDEADTHQQGATWRDRYVIIDEAQLLTRDQMRMMVNRVGEGTKLVLIGDPYQVGATSQVTHWFLNKRNNGLTHVVEKLQGQELYGHMTFSDDATIMRSKTARELGKLL